MSFTDPASADECEKELEDFFTKGTIDDKDLKAFAEAGFALAKRTAVEEYVVELEKFLNTTWQELTGTTGAKGGTETKYAQKVWDFQRKKSLTNDLFLRQNLLAMALTKAEMPLGFTVIPVQQAIVQAVSEPSGGKPATAVDMPDTFGTKKTIVMDGVLRPEDFKANIAEHLPWVDLGAGPEHGYFTHRIQWNVLYNNAARVDFTPELVAKSLAFSKKPVNNSDPVTVWDFLFDRVKIYKIKKGQEAATPHYSTRTDDFRSPEFFNDYLKTTGATYPILAAYVNKPNLS